MLVGAVGVLGYEKLLERWARKGFTDIQRLGLVAGAIGFFMSFDFILELLGKLGMSAVGIGFFILMIMLRRRIRLRIPIGAFSLPKPGFEPQNPPLR